jgi:hypothetical protein
VELRDCLDQCSLGVLRQIAAAHDVSVAEPPARAEIVQALSERLLAPGYLKRLVRDLRDDERQALELVAADGGQLRGFVLERRLRPPESEDDDPASSRALSGLVQTGLLYRTFQAVGPIRGEVYVLPDELLPLLPPRPTAQAQPPAPVDAPGQTRLCSSAFNVFAMASFIRRWRQSVAAGRPPRSEGQLVALSRETADLAAELPGRSSRERWTLLAHLGLQLGLFVRKEGGLQPTEAIEEWLSLGDAGEHRLWTTYVAAEHWNDLDRAGSGGERFAGRTVESPAARAQVLDMVRELSTEEWTLASELERLIRERAPDFLREGFEAAASQLVDLESGEVLAGAGSWDRVEAPLLAYLFGGPLFWLGVLEWGLGPDGWDRVRLTRAGRVWLEGSDEALVQTPAPLNLSDDLRLVAPQDCDLGLLWGLELYLELERRGPPSQYVLTRSSFGRGVQAGGSAAELRRLLERGAGGAPPRVFQSALQRWGEEAGRLRLRPMVVLTAEQADDLADVLERSEVAELLREPLGPKAAAVAPARAAELAEALERLGHIPQVDSALRLMAGRRAYSALVDQQSLEALLLCTELIKAVKPDLLGEVPHADRLIQRLEEALGPIAAPRISRRARNLARQLRAELRKG